MDGDNKNPVKPKPLEKGISKLPRRPLPNQKPNPNKNNYGKKNNKYKEEDIRSPNKTSEKAR
jgi:hypothetical protein